MLDKVLRRIKVPDRLNKIILLLFRDRKFQIIIKDGLTDIVITGNGIDQGETILSIL